MGTHSLFKSGVDPNNSFLFNNFHLPCIDSFFKVFNESEVCCKIASK